MNGDDYLNLKEILKYVLSVFIWPVVMYLTKRFNTKQDKLHDDMQEHKVKFAVLQSKVESIDDDIREIKDSLDKLPERIKADIKDILNNGKK